MAEKTRMYQLYELRDEIRKAVTNSKMVENSERNLVGIILSSGKQDDFTDFIKSLTENWKDYEHNRLILNSRLEKINKIISMYEKKDENSQLVSDIVSLVLEAIGATKPEEKKEENDA